MGNLWEYEGMTSEDLSYLDDEFGDDDYDEDEDEEAEGEDDWLDDDEGLEKYVD